MKIAIVGAGVSGLTAAYLLSGHHDVTLFETRPRVGGHAFTEAVVFRGDRQAIETGFIVYNPARYPLFCRLLDLLGVRSHPSDMSFSVCSEHSGRAYRGSSINSLFAQRVNVFSPSFLRMVRDIFRFFRDASHLVAESSRDLTLGEYLDEAGYSQPFIDEHILPLGAALWSVSPARIRQLPARFFAQFLDNHAMLQVRGRPQWRTITGGCRHYVDRIESHLGDRVRVGAQITAIRRDRDDVTLTTREGDQFRADHVIVATHSDQALAMLSDADEFERDTLSAIRYQRNDIVLHTDTRLLPPNRRAWASWNYFVPSDPSERASVTYYMNRLQGLTSPHHYCLTLNQSTRIDPASVIRSYRYDHPVFTTEGVRAQRRRSHFVNRRRTSFCGAYWGFGFHEDGVRSAVEVAERWGGRLK